MYFCTFTHLTIPFTPTYTTLKAILILTYFSNVFSCIAFQWLTIKKWLNHTFQNSPVHLLLRKTTSPIKIKHSVSLQPKGPFIMHHFWYYIIWFISRSSLSRALKSALSSRTRTHTRKSSSHTVKTHRNHFWHISDTFSVSLSSAMSHTEKLYVSAQTSVYPWSAQTCTLIPSPSTKKT